MNSGTTSLPCSTASSSAGLSLSRRSTSLNHITTTFEFGPLARAVAGTVDGAVDGATVPVERALGVSRARLLGVGIVGLRSELETATLLMAALVLQQLFLSALHQS